jgi:hypothetical protein
VAAIFSSAILFMVMVERIFALIIRHQPDRYDRIAKMQTKSLSHFSRMLALTSTNSPFNVVIVLQISPRPGIEKVQDALNALQEAHLSLRSRIVGTSQFTQFFDVETPIPVEEVWVDDTSVWTQYAESKLNTQFDLANESLIQCLILNAKTEDKAALLFTINHIILDARSAPDFLKDFLQLLGGEITAPQTQSLIPPDIRTMLPPEHQGIRGAFGLTGFILRKMGEEMLFRLRKIGQSDLPLQNEAGCRIHVAKFTEDETQAIVRKSRSLGVTLNSILISALVVATCKVLYPNKKRQVQLIAFADLRPFLIPPLGPETPGNAISMLQIGETLPKDAETWSFSKQAQETLKKAFQRGDKFYSFLLSDRLIEMVIRLKKIRLGTSALSYIGPLDLPINAGPYTLTGFNAFISNNQYGPITSMQARLFQECLYADMLYLASDIGPETAVQIMEEFRQQLLK